jgi:hypothetical protein
MQQERTRGSVRDITKGIIAFLNTPITLPKRAAKKGEPRKSGRRPPLCVEGELRSGSIEKFAVDGRDFKYDENTCVIGNIEMGAMARVKLTMVPGRGAYATSITITKPTACH